MKEVQKASSLTSEKVWELPLWEEYTREIKGKYADIQNIGQGRLAGTIYRGRPLLDAGTRGSDRWRRGTKYFLGKPGHDANAHQ